MGKKKASSESSAEARASEEAKGVGATQKNSARENYLRQVAVNRQIGKLMRGWRRSIWVDLILLNCNALPCADNTVAMR